MEWQQILGFYHVAKLGSFTKAAEATFRTQSALSQQVRALEEELECTLFERIGKRGIRLTIAGEKFLSFAERVLESYEGLTEELNEVRRLKKGRLRIAAPFTTLYHLLPAPLQVYMDRFPWVELTVMDCSQDRVIDLVKKGDVDFGLALESVVPKELTALRWLQVKTVLIVPSEHPLTEVKRVNMHQIAQYPLILPPKAPEHSGRVRLEELFRDGGIEYRMVMESSNVELSSLYVESGLGISFATLAMGLPAGRGRKLAFVSLDHYFDPGYVALIMRRQKALSPLKRAFANILLDENGVLE